MKTPFDTINQKYLSLEPKNRVILQFSVIGLILICGFLIDFIF